LLSSCVLHMLTFFTIMKRHIKKEERWSASSHFLLRLMITMIIKTMIITGAISVFFFFLLGNKFKHIHTIILYHFTTHSANDGTVYKAVVVILERKKTGILLLCRWEREREWLTESEYKYLSNFYCFLLLSYYCSYNPAALPRKQGWWFGSCEYNS